MISLFAAELEEPKIGICGKGLTNSYCSGIKTAFPSAVDGIAHFFCLFGGSLSAPGFSVPLANTIGASFYKDKVKNGSLFDPLLYNLDF